MYINAAAIRCSAGSTLIKSEVSQLGYVRGKECFGDVTILWAIDFLFVKTSQESEEDLNTHCKFLRILATETERNVQERGCCLFDTLYQLLSRLSEEEI